MNHLLSWLYVVVYCLAAEFIGIFVGGVAGVGVATLLIEPEEAKTLVVGLAFGCPLGALIGFILGIVAMRRRLRDLTRSKPPAAMP
jgi:membrane protein DedA with SNARE-associated domain